MSSYSHSINKVLNSNTNFFQGFGSFSSISGEWEKKNKQKKGKRRRKRRKERDREQEKERGGDSEDPIFRQNVIE